MPTPETVGPAAHATLSSATPFESDIGEMFGDFTDSGGAPDPEAEADETTSSEPADGAEPGAEREPAPTTGDESAAARDGTTPAAQTEPPDDDPFKDTTPASYVVDGKTIPVEDIRVFKEGGAVIRPESLPNILSKLAERDTLSTEARTVKQQYDTLAKVSEWTGADNQTVTGPQAAIERIVAHAAVLSENQLLIEHLTDPDKLYALLTTEQVPDGNGGMRERVIISPSAIKYLQTENENRQWKATQAIRDHFGKVVSESSKPVAAPIDYAAQAPQLVAQLATQSQLDASVLTPADQAMLARQLPAHVRDGLVSVEWQDLVKERIQERTTQKASTQRLVTTTQDATKKGLANMAAAARGVKPATTKAPPVKPVTPQSERLQNEGDLYDQMERSAAIALRSAR
jgi:hypothetical protein